MTTSIRSRIATWLGGAAVCAAFFPLTMILGPFVLGNIGILLPDRLFELCGDVGIHSFLSLAIAAVVLGGISVMIQRNRGGGIGAVVGSLMLAGVGTLRLAAALGALDWIFEIH